MSSYHELTGIEVDEDAGIITQFRQPPAQVDEGTGVENHGTEFAEGETAELVSVSEGGEKTLKSMTKAELVDHGTTVGVPAEVAEGLTKAELVDAIGRLTHRTD